MKGVSSVLRLAAVCVAAAALVAACSTVGPPIQEMSDARLAVTTKVDGMPQRVVMNELVVAAAILTGLWLARRDANLAKESAVAAREAAKEARAKPPSYPEQPIKPI